MADASRRDPSARRAGSCEGIFRQQLACHSHRYDAFMRCSCMRLPNSWKITVVRMSFQLVISRCLDSRPHFTSCYSLPFHDDRRLHPETAARSLTHDGVDADPCPDGRHLAEYKALWYVLASLCNRYRSLSRRTSVHGRKPDDRKDRPSSCSHVLNNDFFALS